MALRLVFHAQQLLEATRQDWLDEKGEKPIKINVDVTPGGTSEMSGNLCWGPGPIRIVHD